MDEATAEQIRTLMADAGLKPPGAPILMITDHCNLHCRHCWPDSGRPIKAPPVPLEQLQGMVRNFVLLGAEEICLTGGEPLTHPHWLDILIFSGTVSALKNVRIQTNGTLLTHKIVNTLASTDFKWMGDDLK